MLFAVPYSIPLVFMLDILKQNKAEIFQLYLSDFLLISAGLTIITGLLYKVLKLLLPPKQHEENRVALIAGLLTLITVTGGRLFTVFNNKANLLLFKLTIKDPIVYSLVIIIIIGLLVFTVLRLKSSQAKLIHQMLASFVWLVSLALVVEVFSGHLPTPANIGDASSEVTKLHETSTKQNKNHPNVYYIILDGYANASVLNKVLEFDNSSFLNEMQNKGFFLAEESTANYPLTGLSLPSSLNFDYLGKLPQGKENADARSAKVKRLIQQNKVMQTFKKYGYQTVSFASPWGLTEHIAAADVNINCGFLNEFTFTVLKETIAGVWINKFNNSRRSQILCPFKRIPQLIKKQEQQPQFIFAHVVSPHSPYLFDAQGNNIEDTESLNHAKTSGTQKAPYLAQLQYINTLTLALVDDILTAPQNKSQQPIIIIQSDHGSATLFPTIDSWQNPKEKQLFERMLILNLYYGPKEFTNALYSDMTPVNSFRVVINTLFSEDVPLLEDKNFWRGYGKFNEDLQSDPRLTDDEFLDITQDLKNLSDYISKDQSVTVK